MKVKRVHKDAVLPRYAKEGDSGFDLVAVQETIIEPGETKLIKTGLAFDIPKGYEIQVRPRSGVTLRTKLRVQLGTVDSNYRGEVGVIVDHILDEPWNWSTGGLTVLPTVSTLDGEIIDWKEDIALDSYLIRKGDRIAQGVLVPVVHTTFEEVDKLSNSERGTNGYGSTGVSANVDKH